jgi:hypothetical protein
MKKLIVLLALVVAYAAPVLAQTEAREYRSTHAGAEAKTNTYTLRGELYSIYVAMPAGSPTATVSVVSSEGTLFSKSGITASGWFHPRFQTHDSAGNALSIVASESTTNAVRDRVLLAGPVTVTVTPTTQIVTNNYTVKVIYKP